ncbi:MAG: hypothetical protein GY795_16725 [Desulfobacterales bacterium]|nr:hypothetical protein [Desulfobacterales bacterium]
MISEVEKAEAFKFFRDLELLLNKKIPGPKELIESVSSIVEDAKNSGMAPHKKIPESAFLNHYVVPLLHDFIASLPDFDKEKATQTILSESYRNLGEYASGTPARSQPHPFKMAIGTKAQDVIEQWKGNKPGSPVVQSCPDMALNEPSPYRVIIEGKYFTKGGIQAAETTLATDIYQTFFYLGLSNVPATSTHPAWNYDYGLLLAYDATDEGSLLNAWQSLDTKVKEGCWEGANIYVMILRGND